MYYAYGGFFYYKKFIFFPPPRERHHRYTRDNCFYTNNDQPAFPFIPAHEKSPV